MVQVGLGSLSLDALLVVRFDNSQRIHKRAQAPRARSEPVLRQYEQYRLI